jgi:hypothetical protein
VPNMHRKHSCNGRRSRIHGGILALCIGKLRKLFRANRFDLVKKTKEKQYGNK